MSMDDFDWMEDFAMPRVDHSNEFVEVSVIFKHQTPGDKGAVLVKDGDKEVWIPKSQFISETDFDSFEKEKVIDIEITEWIATVKGLV